MLAETSWKAVSGTAYDVAVLPWGATEAHNWHLPYATDVIQCDHVAAEAARLAWERGARAIVLPTVPFGVQTGQLDIPLCLNLNPSTQAVILEDLADALAGQGIRRAGDPERPRRQRLPRHHPRAAADRRPVSLHHQLVELRRSAPVLR